MQVSAISSNSYTASNYFQPWALNSKGCDAETNFNIYTPETAISDYYLYYNINQWKHFCHKQIAKGNLDVIA